MWGIFFGEFQCLPVNDCSAVSCDSGAPSTGSEHTSFYSALNYILIKPFKNCCMPLEEIPLVMLGRKEDPTTFSHFTHPLHPKKYDNCGWVTCFRSLIWAHFFPSWLLPCSYELFPSLPYFLCHTEAEEDIAYWSSKRHCQNWQMTHWNHPTFCRLCF